MLVAVETHAWRAPMLVAKSFGTGVIAGVVAIVLYLVVVVLIPVVLGLLQSSMTGGGAIVGGSVSIELGVLVAVVGFLLGFGWTLLKGWVGE
jgi:hypothetical protein